MPDKHYRDAVITLKIFSERLIYVKTDYCLLFTDYWKTFDTVKRNDIIHLLDDLTMNDEKSGSPIPMKRTTLTQMQ